MKFLVTAARTGELCSVRAERPTNAFVVWPDFVVLQTLAELSLPADRRLFFDLDALPTDRVLTRKELDGASSDQPFPCEHQRVLRESRKAETRAWAEYRSAYGQREAIATEGDQLRAQAKAITSTYLRAKMIQTAAATDVRNAETVALLEAAANEKRVAWEAAKLEVAATQTRRI